MKSADPSIKTILHIFDHCIKAIVPYGCENWGVFNITQKRKTLLLFNTFKEWEMEKLNLRYCKHILGVTKLYKHSSPFRTWEIPFIYRLIYVKAIIYVLVL